MPEARRDARYSAPTFPTTDGVRSASEIGNDARDEGARTRTIYVLQIHAQVLLSRIFVAGSFTIGVLITHAMEPSLLTLLRFALATLLFFPIVLWRYGWTVPGPAALGRYSLISASIVAFFWLMFEALRFTSALNASAIHTLVPGLSALWAAVLVKERLQRAQLVALGFGLVGTLCVIFKGDVDALLAFEIGKGDLIFFVGCVAMGLYTPLIRWLHRGEPAPLMSFWVLATGTVWLLVLNGTSTFSMAWTSVELKVYAGIAYLAIFTTLLTFLIQQHATLHIGPTRVATYGYLTPALVVLVEWAGGSPLPNVATLVGIAVILAAIVVVQRGSMSRG